MRLLVIDHSDNAGVELPDPHKARPWLVAEALEAERQEPVDVVHKTVSPIRAGVVAFVGDVVSESGPDVVWLAVNPFWFAATTVKPSTQIPVRREAGRMGTTR